MRLERQLVTGQQLLGGSAFPLVLAADGPMSQQDLRAHSAVLMEQLATHIAPASKQHPHALQLDILRTMSTHTLTTRSRSQPRSDAAKANIWLHGGSPVAPPTHGQARLRESTRNRVRA